MKMAADNRRAQIVEEATRLFSQEGFDLVTTKRLASACGITEPALYRYFPSKDSIYDSVLEQLERRFGSDELLAPLDVERDIEKLLRGLALHILAQARDNEDTYRLLLFAALKGHAKAKQVYMAIRGRFASFLQRQLDRLLTEGSIIQGNNEITSRCFTGMVFDCALGVTLWRGYQGKKYKPTDVVENNVPIFVRGLRR